MIILGKMRLLSRHLTETRPLAGYYSAITAHNYRATWVS